MTETVQGLVDHLFRRSAGQMVATLTRIFGPAHLSLAEEVVQEALLTALQQWRMSAIPDNPEAWLFQVARNRALDAVRRLKSFDEKVARLEVAASAESEWPGFAHEPEDDQLRMMLMCCHPAIPEDGRIALTLKTVGGFSVEEIARAFLTKDDTIAQRIVRAKRLIRDEKIPVEMPSREELPERIESVLKVLYLTFNEGYSAHTGEDLIRNDVVAEAIRLARLVADHPLAGTPAASALASLMLLQGARLPARLDTAGELATLEDQDRSLWDRAMIFAGVRYLDRSAAGDRVTAYHIEAALAAVHSTAPSFEDTDWQHILQLYDELLAVKPSPVVALNRAVALAMLRGPQAGIAAVEQLAAHNSLRDYLPFPVTLGELWLRAGDPSRAATWFSRALELPSTTPEKRFLLRKLEHCRGDRAHGSA
jgi:RNA polymerase sigma-70 factor (ECF subfamily)